MFCIESVLFTGLLSGFANDLRDEHHLLAGRVVGALKDACHRGSAGVKLWRLLPSMSILRPGGSHVAIRMLVDALAVAAGAVRVAPLTVEAPNGNCVQDVAGP